MEQNVTPNLDDYLSDDEESDDETSPFVTDPQKFIESAEKIYLRYQKEQQKHDWIRSGCFNDELLNHLEEGIKQFFQHII